MLAELVLVLQTELASGVYGIRLGSLVGKFDIDVPLTKKRFACCSWTRDFGATTSEDTYGVVWDGAEGGGGCPTFEWLKNFWDFLDARREDELRFFLNWPLLPTTAGGLCYVSYRHMMFVPPPEAHQAHQAPGATQAQPTHNSQFTSEPSPGSTRDTQAQLSDSHQVSFASGLHADPPGTMQSTNRLLDMAHLT